MAVELFSICLAARAAPQRLAWQVMASSPDVTASGPDDGVCSDLYAKVPDGHRRERHGRVQLGRSEHGA